MVGLLEELELSEIPGGRSKRVHGLFLVFHTSRLPDSACMSGGEGEEVLCVCRERGNRNRERSPSLAFWFVWFVFLQASLAFVAFPACLARSVCYPVLEGRNNNNKMVRRKLEYNGWFGCCGSSKCWKSCSVLSGYLLLRFLRGF